MNYDNLTNEQFDNMLQILIIRDAAQLLTIPGVYEVLSEHYNNEILDLYDKEREEDDETA